MSEKKKKGKKKSFFDNKALVIITAVIVLEILFIGVYFLTRTIYKNVINEETTAGSEELESDEMMNEAHWNVLSDSSNENTTASSQTTTANADVAVVSSTSSSSSDVPGTLTVPYPSDNASWQMICLNRYRCVDASVEDNISLSYVAGSSELMDSRAAAAYEKMYDAAADDDIYLTPCSGYRSYSRQKTLYYEFVDEYIYAGYSESEAHDLASKRRNPPGSSEHNIGICMDIICAASSADFQNTAAYAWLDAHAQDYGFILRYPEDKVDITGVKFEPWHWRYVGVENARAINASGLCLEEYLGLA